MDKRKVIIAKKAFAVREIGTMADAQTMTRFDARGLFCPMPILKASAILETLHKGQQLEVLADDPAAPSDFAAYSRRTGHPLRESTEDAGTYRFVLEHK